VFIPPVVTGRSVPRILDKVHGHEMRETEMQYEKNTHKSAIRRMSARRARGDASARDGCDRRALTQTLAVANAIRSHG